MIALDPGSQQRTQEHEREHRALRTPRATTAPYPMNMGSPARKAAEKYQATTEEDKETPAPWGGDLDQSLLHCEP
jgi:hypothetical protein